MASENLCCPYCAKLKLCSDNDCDSCFNNSFASYPKVKYWSKKNKINPRQVFKKSNSKKYLFDCKECDCEFESYPLGIVRENRWCPYCVNKTEKKLFRILVKIFPDMDVVHGFKPDWCINKETDRKLPFDIVLPELKIIIELDGEQHFKQISNWTPPEQTFERDKYKMKRANKNGYRVIRLLQMDVYKEKHDIINQLILTIFYLAKNNNKIENIFICNNNEYDILSINSLNRIRPDKIYIKNKNFIHDRKSDI